MVSSMTECDPAARPGTGPTLRRWMQPPPMRWSRSPRSREQACGGRIRARTVPVEDRYPEMIETLDWYVESGRPEAAYRLASALVPFWIATNRIDDGDAWFERALGTTDGEDAARARALHDHGYLVFWAGRYDLAEAAVHRLPGPGGDAG